jgi:hypothetical protein
VQEVGRRKSCFLERYRFDARSYEKRTFPNSVKSSNRCDDVKVANASGKFSFSSIRRNGVEHFPYSEEWKRGFRSPIFRIAIQEKPGADSILSGRKMIIRQETPQAY